MSNNQLYVRAGEAYKLLGISRISFWRLTKKSTPQPLNSQTIL